MGFIPDLWFPSAHAFFFSQLQICMSFFIPSLKNLVYPHYELLTCFTSFMSTTVSSLHISASICRCPHTCVQDQTWQQEHLAPQIPYLNHLIFFICHGVLSICPLIPFYHPSAFTCSIPLYQSGKLVISSCFILFILSHILHPLHIND